MIDDNFLDGVLYVMERIVAHILEVATNLFYLFVALLIVATTPIWILPFMILRPRDNSDEWSDE